MIYTITLNPAIDQHITIKKLIKDDRLKAEKIQRDPGGKGINVSRVVKELGGQTKAFGLIGGCGGYMLRDLLERNNIDYQFTEIMGETRINFIMTDLSDSSQTRVSAPGPEINEKNIQDFMSMLSAVNPRPLYWVVGGSLPPGAPRDTYKILIQSLQQKGERCVLDTDGEALEIGLEARPFMVKPNEFELERLVGKPIQDDEEILEAGREICNKGIEVVVVSLGKRGAMFVTRTMAWRLQGPEDIKVRSKVGAGDSLLGGVLVSLERGESLEIAARWGIAASAAAVMSEGTKLCARKDVERLFGSISAVPMEYDDNKAKDIVCGMEINKIKTSSQSRYKESVFYFCSMVCKNKFAADPEKFLARENKYTARPF